MENGYDHEDNLKDIDLGLPDDVNELKDRIKSAVLGIWLNAQIDGSHHKLWTLNNVLERLIGVDKVDEFIAAYEKELDDGDYYEWDKGIAP